MARKRDPAEGPGLELIIDRGEPAFLFGISRANHRWMLMGAGMAALAGALLLSVNSVLGGIVLAIAAFVFAVVAYRMSGRKGIVLTRTEVFVRGSGHPPLPWSEVGGAKVVRERVPDGPAVESLVIYRSGQEDSPWFSYRPMWAQAQAEDIVQTIELYRRSGDRRERIGTADERDRVVSSWR